MKLEQLTSVLDFQGGSQPPKKDFESQPSKSNIRFLQIRDFKTDDKIVYIPISKKNRLCKKEDILIARYGASVGQILSGKEGAYNVALMKVIDKNELYKSRYLYYFFNSPYFQNNLLSRSERSAQAGFNKGDLSEIKISVPSLQEQEKIVERLDNTYKNINKSIEHDLAKINSLKALFSQLLSKKFEDISNQRNTTIGNEFNLANGATPLKSNKNFYENGEIPFLITGDFKNKFIYETSKFITEEGLENSSAKIYPTNSIVVAMYGATAGKVGILKIECASNQAVCCLYPNDYYDEEFIYYFFLNFKEELVSQATGSAQPNISQQKISKFKFYEINIVQQRKIIHEIKTVENIVKDYIEKTNNKITKYSSLLTSILNKEFSYE